ncbi:MAG: DEAD/DEAH box helicase [Methanomicrobiales archaeon]|nr:DEAD/DEAH box helicase [Methanomicrobiales archaeon]
MRVIVHPQRGTYKLLCLEGGRVAAVGEVELSETPRGYRPKHYQVRKAGARHGKAVPTKEAVALLRSSDVLLARPDPAWEAFLRDHQVPVRTVPFCRICLLEDRVTPLDPATRVAAGKEWICPDCARKEVRRELGYFTRFGRIPMRYIEELLDRYRDLDRVLASVQPEGVDLSRTLFDRIEAHPVAATAAIGDLGLPPAFVAASGVERLMPVQQMAVDAGLLAGRHQLVVSATASGKTFIGEMAGLRNLAEGRGRMLFLVPLVALANQKFHRFRDRYGKLFPASLLTGRNRLNLPENRAAGPRNPEAPIVVGTYEGVDHLIRSGRKLPRVGTVVIDEVQMLEDPERGHRLDGLIARLKYMAPGAQFLYLSATIGSPHLLAEKLGADLVTYAERPVALERHLLFVERDRKIRYEKELVESEFALRSSKGYRGQTIIFTHSRARCHVIAGKLGRRAAAYHAGLTSQERRDVEERFLSGKIAAVVTTAALGAGVDFPASQVIFDTLAMGIEWLTVQEFHQMSGRSGRPDFHDRGKVVILAEPGAAYTSETKATEEEVAIRLLRGEMEEVAPVHGFEASGEELAANCVACHGNEADLRRIGSLMVGTLAPVEEMMEREGLISRKDGRVHLSPLARVMAAHFIGMERLRAIRDLVEAGEDPLEILSELECTEPVPEEAPVKGRK